MVFDDWVAIGFVAKSKDPFERFFFLVEETLKTPSFACLGLQSRVLFAAHATESRWEARSS